LSVALREQKNREGRHFPGLKPSAHNYKQSLNIAWTGKRYHGQECPENSHLSRPHGHVTGMLNFSLKGIRAVKTGPP
jgi:hypothetical protein